MIKSNNNIRALLISMIPIHILDGGKGSDGQRTFIRRGSVWRLNKESIVK